jgi:16S rRNA (guanine527-N7)-methyltransferase
VAQSLEDLLARGLAAQGLECDQAAQQRLITFVHLLQKWNKVYNLTAIRDPQQMLIRHILDSLSILPYLQGPRIIDVGAGAGLPGIPLALLSPHYTFVELDSVAKKTRFMQQAVIELGLANVSVQTARAEELPENAHYDTVMTRAFASLADMIAKAGRLCAPGGRLLAMKGNYPEQELADIPPTFSVQGVHKLSVFGLDEQRYLVQLSPCAP